MSTDDRPPGIDEFLGEPTREIRDWRWLWTEDVELPIRSHRRGVFGALLVLFKRLLRPFVTVPQRDLWERQRVFNLILLEHVETARNLAGGHEHRIEHLEALPDVLVAHNDALFSRVDQKVDRSRRQAQDLLVALREALAAVPADGPAEPLARVVEDEAYRELEDRVRGDADEIADRARRYLPDLAGAPGPILDLGCGRGEALAALAEAGHRVSGVDANAAMVAACEHRGLDVRRGDLFEALRDCEPGSLGGVVSFHVVEHLPPALVVRLVRLAHRALAPGGRLVIETPNPLSVVVAARSFWLDPTHVRPVHPEWLASVAEEAGFERVEVRPATPFPTADRLPEIDVAAAPPEAAALVDQVNRLRDRLDDLLFGFQDVAVVARKAGAAG